MPFENEESEGSSLKRPKSEDSLLSSDNEENALDKPLLKRLKRDETQLQETSTSVSTSRSREITPKPGLLSCCDDLLLNIFSYLNHSDLVALSECCETLYRVVFDRTLWEKVDLSNKELDGSELKKYEKYFLPSTRYFATKGPWKRLRNSNHTEADLNPTITTEFLDNICKAAPNLTTLILENHLIYRETLQMVKLPPEVDHFSLKGCHFMSCPSDLTLPQDCVEVCRTRSFPANVYLPKLKHLDLTGCQWFEPHNLLALSKCSRLEELMLADCQLHDCVPYVSLGTRFGFECLTVVDLRRTWVSDREVSCFNKVEKLQELYLEAPTSEVAEVVGRGELANSLITDIAITSFGSTLDAWREMGYIVVLMPMYEGFLPTQLRVVHLQGYITVTDTSLRHSSSCLKTLKHINVRGTSCTEIGVNRFKIERPDITIESDFS